MIFRVPSVPDFSVLKNLTKETAENIQYLFDLHLVSAGDLC